MSGYEYGNTRLRARRTRLLGPAEFSSMIASGSLDRMLAQLADTDYSTDVEAALVRVRGLHRLDEAIRTNLARSLQEMASFYTDEARTRVDLLLHRWDLRNFRALVRFPQAPLDAEAVSRLLVPAGRLTESELAELAAQQDVRARIELIVAWGIPSPETVVALLRARPAWEVGGDVSVLESALDTAFATTLGGVLGEERTGPASILRGEIDARNLGAALRVRAARLDHEPGWTGRHEAYTPGGLVPTDLWEEVAAADQPEDVIGLVTGTVVVPGWSAALQDWASHDNLPLLADHLQRATTSAAVARFATGDPLGFDIPVAFTFAKESEVRDLRLIGRGIVHGIPPAEIESRLEVAA